MKVNSKNYTLTLRPGKKTWIILFCVFFIIFIICLRNSNNNGIMFFYSLMTGVFSVYAFFRILPSSNYLQLDSKGFKWQALFYKNRYLWKDVDNFYVNRFGYIIFDIFDPTTNRKKSGALPNNYGKNPKELVDLLYKWKNDNFFKS